MGRRLASAHPEIRDALEAAGRICRRPLLDLSWRGPAERLKQTDVLQPALAAVMVGSVDALRAAGRRPDVVAGHSLGEFAALYAADVLSRSDTLSLVAERGRLMQEAAERAPGGMTAVMGLPASAVEAIVDGASVSVANQSSATWLAPPSTFSRFPSRRFFISMPPSARCSASASHGRTSCNGRPPAMRRGRRAATFRASTSR